MIYNYNIKIDNKLAKLFKTYNFWIKIDYK